MDFKLHRIYTDINGYNQIAALNQRLEIFTKPNFQLDCSELKWLDANMCSSLGAVIHRATPRMTITFKNLAHEVHEMLCRNNFLPELCDSKPKADTFSTSIRYHNFSHTEISGFREYTEEFFVDKSRGLPKMTPRLLRRFRESLWEIFENAVAHSETRSIYVCGQFFPQNKRLNFCISDLGIGFKKKINSSEGVSLSAEEAINWAMNDNNTTRKLEDGKPGGIGLKMIRNFLSINLGRMTIFSDSGYWEIGQGKITKESTPIPYPGTSVNIEINTADCNHYCLKEELDPSNIF